MRAAPVRGLRAGLGGGPQPTAPGPPELVVIDQMVPDMTQRQAWDLGFDPATGLGCIHQEEVTTGQILPDSKWPNFFSRLVAKLQWDAFGIDLTNGAEARQGTPGRGAKKLTKLLCGFRVADDAVSKNLTPFGPAARNSLVAWVIFLQRRDEERHAKLLRPRLERGPGGASATRREDRLAAAREPMRRTRHRRALRRAACPAMSAEMEMGKLGLSDGIELYHMTLEGMVLAAGQKALLEASPEDGSLCRASARACTTSSSTSAGTSASGCAA